LAGAILGWRSGAPSVHDGFRRCSDGGVRRRRSAQRRPRWRGGTGVGGIALWRVASVHTRLTPRCSRALRLLGDGLRRPRAEVGVPGGEGCREDTVVATADGRELGRRVVPGPTFLTGLPVSEISGLRSKRSLSPVPGLSARRLRAERRVAPFAMTLGPSAPVNRRQTGKPGPGGGSAFLA